MKKDSDFLRGLVGKPIRITVINEGSLPPMPALILREVSEMGIVASDSEISHFFPWTQIVRITPAEKVKA